MDQWMAILFSAEQEAAGGEKKKAPDLFCRKEELWRPLRGLWVGWMHLTHGLTPEATTCRLLRRFAVRNQLVFYRVLLTPLSFLHLLYNAPQI